MCPSRRSVRFALPLVVVALGALVALVARSRRGVEVWHVAADDEPGYEEGP